MPSYLIDHGKRGLRIAKQVNGRVVSFDFESSIPHYHGGVYLGRVLDILKGGQLAFVDIGLAQPGVLSLKERNFPPVQRGSTVLCQVTREADPKERKGVHLSRNISLSLGPIIYTPFSPGFGISKKVQRRHVCEQLKDKVEKDEGIVLRHWVDQFDLETLTHIIEILRVKWKDVKSDSSCTPPACLSLPPSLLQRFVSALEPGDTIECNDRLAIKELTDLLVQSFGGGPEIIYRHESPFDDSIEDQWDSLTETHINLIGGGQIVIEETAALVSIDINSGGSHLPDHDLNRRALREIFHQVELRNLAGILVIDLAGNIKHPKQIIQSARSLAESGVHVHGITDLGLLEISRRKTGPSLTQMLKNGEEKAT